MLDPDAVLIDSLSRVDFAGLDVPFQVPDELQVLVDQANSYVKVITARDFALLPPVFEPIARQAVRMRTEQVAFQAQPDYAESATDDIVGSFSAGGYSETRHDPTRRGETRAINSWPALAELLWLLLGLAPGEVNDLVDAQRAYWVALLSGQPIPAYGVTEVDWGNQRLSALTPYGLRVSYDDWGNIVPVGDAAWQMGL